MQGRHLEQQKQLWKNYSKNLINLMKETNYLEKLFLML